MTPSDLIADFARDHGLQGDFAHQAGALHLPLAEHVETVAKTRGGTLTVGLCGPQGSGKSTTVDLLSRLLQAQGLRTATLSIDDLYLARGRRRALAARVHPLLLTRGPPGTHDVALGVDVLARLARRGRVRLPRFDKASDDPCPEANWPVFDGPADVVLFEGWCIGARPQAPEALDAPVNALERDRDPDGVWRRFVNDALAGEYQRLFGAIDLLVQLRPPSFETVLRWRRQQEQELRRRIGKLPRCSLESATASPELKKVSPGFGKVSSSFPHLWRRTMSDAEVAVFVQHYERLTRHIDAEMPSRADVLVILGEDRQALSMRFGRQAMAESTPPSVSTS